MPQLKRYPYQTTARIEDHDGEWIDTVAEADGMTKAQVLRATIDAGRTLIDGHDDPETLMSEETYRRSVVRYGYRIVPILSEEVGAWIDETCALYGVDGSSVIRTAITLGRPVIELRRQAVRQLAA